MKVRFTVAWNEEISDEEIKTWAVDQGLIEEGEEDLDIDTLQTEWLESKIEDFFQDPTTIPASASADYEVS